jgi:cysteine-rich repeat protein
MRKVSLVLLLLFWGCGRTGLLPRSQDGAVRDERLCGNGIIDPGEDCDTSNLGGKSCISLGYSGGTLRCTSLCTFDETACVGEKVFCGDGKIDKEEECDDGNDDSTDACIKCKEARCGDGFLFKGVEDCDGKNLDGKTCEDFGYKEGELGCDSSRCIFEFSNCVSPDLCGNCKRDPGEECDPCIDRGCTDICKWEKCRCGNFIIEPECREACDGDNLGGKTCQDLGYDGGELECNEVCKFDTSGCGFCGDQIKDPWEDCEEDDLGGKTCQDLGYDGGELKCKDCKFDASNCHLCGNWVVEGPEECDDGNRKNNDGCSADCKIEKVICGDNKAEGDEECDGDDLKGESCLSLGFKGGTLLCDSNCNFYTLLCWECGNKRIDPGEECDDGNTKSGDGCSADCKKELYYCGDNEINQTHEQCDGSDLGGWDCIRLGYDGGKLKCNEDCFFDVSECWYCGDGKKNPGEECDGSDLGGLDCKNFGFKGGILKCTSECRFDTSECKGGICGDGEKDPDEECDGNDFGNLSCKDFGFSGGPLFCTDLCAIKTDYCWECGNGRIDPNEECDPPDKCCDENCRIIHPCDGCGNGQLDAGEECDGNEFIPEKDSCQKLGYPGGRVECRLDCKVDITKCWWCGNGQLDPGEECDDGNQIPGDGCEPDCTRDILCGNFYIDPGEECDPGEVRIICEDDELGGKDCTDFGYEEGELCCTPGCKFDLSRCKKSGGECGDGEINAGEQCDGSNLAGHTCRTIGEFDKGELRCYPKGHEKECQFDISDCQYDLVCGDGRYDPGEKCDRGRIFEEETCLTLGPEYGGPYDGGPLKCDTLTCDYDIRGCYKITDCELLTDKGCPPGRKCVIPITLPPCPDNGRGLHVCVGIGELRHWEQCTDQASGECGRGLSCYEYVGDFPKCYRYCNDRRPCPNGYTCVYETFLCGEIGICTPSF